MRSRTSSSSVGAPAARMPSSCSIVRGPMIAELTAGWASTKPRARPMMSVPASAASAASACGQLELALVVRALEVEAVRHALHAAGRRDLTLGVAAGQPAAVERAPHEHAHAVALARRQQRLLDPAGEDRVRRLLGAERLEAAAGSGPAGLDDELGRVRRAARVADLAGAHEVVERRQRVLDVGPGVGSVHLVEVDVVGAEAAQRVLDLAGDPAAAVAGAVRSLPHRPVELRRQHHVVATSGERLADDRLGLAARVHVGGVDEVDPGVEGAMDDRHAVVVVPVAHRPEHHGAEAQLADLDPGVPQRPRAHGATLRGR